MARSRILLVVSAIGVLIGLPAHASTQAEPPKVPLLPAIRATETSSPLRADPPEKDVATGDTGLVGALKKKLGEVHIGRGGRQNGLDWRYPMIRDAARDRDATSWGLVHAPPISRGGMACAAAGLVAAGMPVLAHLGPMPFTVAPAIFLGGGGAVINVRW
jgi:hypothetical protein